MADLFVRKDYGLLTSISASLLSDTNVFAIITALTYPYIEAVKSWLKEKWKSMNLYSVKRSRVSLLIGYFLAESILIAFLLGMFIVWQEDPGYLDWNFAIGSWLVVALFFHFLLFTGTFYKVAINGEIIKYHAFCRKTKTFYFSDIKKVRPSTGVDVKILGNNDKRLFYIKLTDRNAGRFLDDIYIHTKGKSI